MSAAAGAVGQAVAAKAVDKAGSAGARLTDSKHKRVVMVAVVGTGLIVTVATVTKRQELPGPRIVAGTAVSSVLLSFAAEAAPKIAAGLAVTMFVTAALSLGGPAWAGISTITRTTPPK